MVPDTGKPGNRTQEMDCGIARAARCADDRCGRRARTAKRKEPAAGGRDQGGGRLWAR